MGYYTYYTVETEPHNDVAIMEVEKLSGYGSTVIDGHDSVKWYDCEKDMTTISKIFPDTTFIVSGDGEESGDIWKRWFKDGKSKYAKADMTIKEPDW